MPKFTVHPLSTPKVIGRKRVKIVVTRQQLILLIVTPIAIEDVKDVFAQVVLPRLLMDGAPPIDGDSFNAELENASVKSKNVLGEIIALCRKNFSRDVLLKAYFVYLAFATTAALALYIRYSSDSGKGTNA